MRSDRFQLPATLGRREILRAAGFSTLAASCGPLLPAADASPSPMRIVNGAAAAGLHFALWNGATGRKYQVERITGGPGVIDFDGDGTFTQVTRKGWLSCDVRQVHGNRRRRLCWRWAPRSFRCPSQRAHLLLRYRGKGWEEVGVEAGVAYNGDGRNISGMGADFSDIDGDSRPDIVMTSLKNETYKLFLNRGKGEFEDGSAQTGLLNLGRSLSGWGCGLVDLDNDGWLDSFVAGGGLEVQDAQGNRIFRKRGGKFVDVSSEVSPQFAQPALHRGVVIADFDRDGRLDAAVTALNSSLELWWNRTGGDHPANH